ncbi:MAG: UDP-N-acetylmuramate dehydrogenase [Acidobacteria bacterium]|nr:UDP-N-acetylmuramate dehydrogenase [Acidobacteriota bacterium]
MAQKFTNKVRENVPLAAFTTFKIGGPARFFVCAETEQDVIDAFDFAARNNLQVFILGGGSNVLIADQGFDGLVVQIALMGSSESRVSCSEPGETNAKLEARNSELTAGAGEDWDQLLKRCVDSNLAGLECLSGIPGTVGGTPVQNVGAYGQEVSETITSVRCYDRRRKTIVELSNADCQFAYRKSIFNTAEKDRYVVLAVTFRLTKNGPPKIAYKELRDFLSTTGSPDCGSPHVRKGQIEPQRSISLKDVRVAVLAIRARKSMVIDPADPNSRSAGSFFKNPLVSI